MTKCLKIHRKYAFTDRNMCDDRERKRKREREEKNREINRTNKTVKK